MQYYGRTKDRVASHPQVTGDHTDVLPLGEDIEGNSFPSTTRAHKSGQSPRLDVSRTTGAARYGNYVVDFLPSEGLTIRERSLLRWNANIVDLPLDILSFLEGLVQCLGLWVLPPEDCDIRSSV